MNKVGNTGAGRLGYTHPLDRKEPRILEAITSSLPVVVSSEFNARFAYKFDFWRHLYSGGNTPIGRIGSGQPLDRKEPHDVSSQTSSLPVVKFLVVSYPKIGQFI